MLNIVIQNPKLFYPLSTSYHKFSTVGNSIIRLCEVVRRILTSDESIDISDTTFNMMMIAMPRGSGVGKKVINLTENVKTKSV